MHLPLMVVQTSPLGLQEADYQFLKHSCGCSCMRNIQGTSLIEAQLTASFIDGDDVTGSHLLLC